MKHRKQCRIGLAALPLAVSMSLVSAQGLEEIVVTAQHQQQSLQDVPIAITALGMEEIERRSMSNVLDIDKGVPNINIARNTGTSSGAKIFLRGIGEDDSRATQDPAVGMYIDDVYLGRQTGSLLDLVDVQRIEVLRGPQGTLYGRNTNGGAIRVVTRKPELESRFKVKGTLGNYDRRELFAVASGALAEQLAGQVSVVHQKRDGFIEDTESSATYGNVDKQGLRGALRHLGENWDVMLSADYSKDDSDPGYPVKARPFDDDRKFFTVTQSQWPTEFPAGRGTVLLRDYFNDLVSKGVSLQAQSALSDEVEFTSITAWRKLENELASNMAGPYYQDVAQEQYSQELRFTGSGDSVDWVTGLFLFREEVDQLTEYVAGREQLDLTTDAAALFGQLTYAVSDELRLTGGLRYTWERKELDATLSPDYWYLLFFGAANMGPLQQKQTWSHLSWKLVADYYLAPETMAYLSVTNGFKSGGWSSDSLQAVDEETVLTYELGLKSQLLENTLRLNLAVFFNDYDDLQINGSVPGFGFTRVNAGKVESYGVEADVTWMATRNLEISAYVGTLEGEYKEIDGRAAAIINKEYELKQAPELVYGLSFNHYLTLGAGELVSSLQYAHSDAYWNDLANTWWGARRATDLINARVAYQWGDDVRYTFAGWVKNLTDQEYIEAIMVGNQSAYPGDPRTFGVDFSVEF